MRPPSYVGNVYATKGTSLSIFPAGASVQTGKGGIENLENGTINKQHHLQFLVVHQQPPRLLHVRRRRS